METDTRLRLELDRGGERFLANFPLGAGSRLMLAQFVRQNYKRSPERHADLPVQEPFLQER